MTEVSIFDVTADMIRPTRRYVAATADSRLFEELLTIPVHVPRRRERVGKRDSYGIPEALTLRTERQYCTRCGISFTRCRAVGVVCADCVDAP